MPTGTGSFVLRASGRRCIQEAHTSQMRERGRDGVAQQSPRRSTLGRSGEGPAGAFWREVRVRLHGLS